MNGLIVALIVGAIIGGFVWNKRNAAAAMRGVEFVVPASLKEVSTAINAAFNVGTAARLKSFVGGFGVSTHGSGFRYASKIGDVGTIDLAPSAEGGTTVRAATDELYVGSHPKTHSRRGGLWSMCTAMTHGIYKLLGVTPGAAKMKRFQDRLEAAIAKQLRKAAR